MVAASVQLSHPLPLLRQQSHSHRCRASSKLSISCTTLTKQSQIFVSRLATTAAAGDELATNRLIRKFVESSPKSTALNALSLLMSPHSNFPRVSSLALTLYSKITEAAWFIWNPKLVADLIALLDKHGKHEESDAMLAESVSKLGFRERELVLFYCRLLESQSKQNAKQGFDKTYDYLSQLLDNSSSVYVRRRAYESMVLGLCTMDRPQEAENLIERVRAKGVKPSAFEFKSVIQGYGRLGLMKDMSRIIERMEREGFAVDTVCSNMVLSSYGAHNYLGDMILWLRRMRTSSIPLSIRTYNTVLNSCPTIMSQLEDMNTVPLSNEELRGILHGDEALLVEELVGSSLLQEVMVWEPMEVKLDLHGMHLGTAHLIMLLWVEEIRRRFRDGKSLISQEIVVVCGSGKHGSVRGESPVKSLVKTMMIRMGSPMKIDRKNTGCFVAKGNAVRSWLC